MFDVYIFALWPALLAWRWRRRTLQSTALIGLGLFASVVIIRWAGKVRAEEYTRRSLAAQGLTTEVQSIPDYFRPWIWYVRGASRPEGWRVINVIDQQVLDEAAPRDPRRIGIGFGGL